MVRYDENASFGLWADRWFKYKCIGLSRDYSIAIQSQVGYLTDYLGDIAVTEIKPYDVDYVIGEIATCNPYTKKPTAKKHFVISEILQEVSLIMLLRTRTAIRKTLPEKRNCRQPHRKKPVEH